MRFQSKAEEKQQLAMQLVGPVEDDTEPAAAAPAANEGGAAAFPKFTIERMVPDEPEEDPVRSLSLFLVRSDRLLGWAAEVGGERWRGARRCVAGVWSIHCGGVVWSLVNVLCVTGEG